MTASTRKAARLYPDEVRVPIAHFSMQFSDNTAQKRHDAQAIFDRETDRGAWWITGTEAGAGESADLRAALADEAERHGYTFFVKSDTWVSLDRRRIVPRTRVQGYEPALDSSEGTGKHTDKGVTWAGAELVDIGRTTVGALHLLTRGRPSGKGIYRENLDENRRYAEVVGRWGMQHGRGRGLVVVHGDMNIVDKIDDVFLGQADFTTTWDELGKWENTGHGNIDVLATWDHDGRVRALKTNALTDKEFHLFTDHFGVEGELAVRKLAA